MLSWMKLGAIFSLDSFALWSLLSEGAIAHGCLRFIARAGLQAWVLCKSPVSSSGWYWYLQSSSCNEPQAPMQLLECHSEWVSVGRSVTETINEFQMRWKERRWDSDQGAGSLLRPSLFTPCSDWCPKKCLLPFHFQLHCFHCLLSLTLPWIGSGNHHP